MDALTLLTTRRSVRELREPAPNAQDLETMFQAATQVPDHGNLTPWEFVVVQGEAAFARFRRILEETVETMGYDEAARKKIDKVCDMAPMMIAVIARPKTEGPKPKPVWEQEMSAAAAAYALQLSSVALGYGNVWITGLWCGSPVLRREMQCAEHDKIIGLLMVGTPVGEPKYEAKNTETGKFVTRWQAV